jgi:uncharacterized protein (DUF169 family)
MSKKEYSIEDYRKFGEDLYHKLHFSTYPIAVKYIKSESEIPDKAIRPAMMGKEPRKIAICQAFAMTRKFGMTVGMTEEDNFCVPSSLNHGWVDLTLDELVESQVRQGWHDGLEAEKRLAEMNIKSTFGERTLEDFIKEGYIGIVTSPLPKTLVVPDAIGVYGSAGQITHIIHALSYEVKPEYMVDQQVFAGFGETCSKLGFRPFMTQKPQIMIPGTGDRVFAVVDEHEIGIGIPGHFLFYLMKFLFKPGGRMNVGWPIKSMAPIHFTEEHTPGFKYLRDLIDKKKGKK